MNGARGGQWGSSPLFGKPVAVLLGPAGQSRAGKEVGL